MTPLPYESKLVSYAKALRREATRQEKHLWYDFLSHCNPRFQRQKPISNYIADFYCDAAKLVIEIDGAQHYEEENLKYDEERTQKFAELGIFVIRFTNRDIDFHFPEVCSMIEETVKERL